MEKFGKYSFFVLVLIFSSYSNGWSQKEWDKYKYRTLAEIISFNRDSTEKILKTAKLDEKQDFIGADLFYSRIRLEYIGTPRTISTNHRDLITLWARLQNIDQKVVELYESEVLVKECGVEYWIPIQKKIADDNLKKLKSGEMVTLFVIYVGERKDVGVMKLDHLFLSTAIEK
jgi:hypothetical protein